MSEIQKRVGTAFVLAIICFLPAYYFSRQALLVMVSVFCVICCYEWAGFLLWQYRYKFHLMTLLFLSLLILGRFLPFSWTLGLGIVACLWLWLSVLSFQYKGYSLGLSLSLNSFLIGAIILVAFVYSVDFLRGRELRASFWLFYPVFLSAFVDASGYFIGKAFGQHKMMPSVSPKKSWEGFLAGVAVGCVFSALCGFYALPPRCSLLEFLVLSFLCVIASVMGDLSISVLKRIANVKDSGEILPGHGGILDRLDSIIPSVLVFAAGLCFLSL